MNLRLPFRAWFGIFSMALVILAQVACNRRDAASIGNPGTPLVFMVSNAHGHFTRQTDGDTLKQVASALSDASGLAVEVRAAATPVAGIEAFGAGRADMGLLPLMQFLLAHKEYEVQARLQVVRGAARDYKAQLLVKENSDLTALAQLQGKSVAFVNKYSVSGYLLPATMLIGLGVRAEFTGSHEDALSSLRAGRVDAAATYVGALARTDGLRALATTRAVPNEPVFFRKGLDPDKTELLVAALQRMAGTEVGAGLLKRLGSIEGFHPVTDAEYADARAIIRDAGQRLEEVVPGGRSIVINNIPSTLQVPRD